MVRKPKKRNKHKTHSIKVEFSDEKVTSLGGMVLKQRAAMHLRLWSILAHHLPERSGDYSWLEVVQSMIAGLLTDARGTFFTQDLRKDEALLELLGLPGAQEKAFDEILTDNGVEGVLVRRRDLASFRFFLFLGPFGGPGRFAFPSRSYSK